MEEHTWRTIVKDEERNLKETKIICFKLLVRFLPEKIKRSSETKNHRFSVYLKEQRKR